MAISITVSADQNSQNVTNNSSNVTCAVKAKWTGGSYNQLQKSGWLKIDGTKYDFTSSFNTGKSTSGSQTLFSKTVDVSHNSDGTKTLAVSASYTSGVSSGTVTASANKTLTTIPRKSTLSGTAGILGTETTLTVTRHSSSFTHTITYKCGTASGTICTKSTSTSVKWTPPLSLASQNTTGINAVVEFTITTYNGSTSLGSNTKSIGYTMPSSVIPSCSIAVSDPTGHKDTYNGYVQGVSRFAVTITGTPSYGSPIASYSSSANGMTYSTASFTTGVISSSGELTITAKVTDKRKRSGSNSVKATVIPYSKPKINKLSVGRCDDDGTDNDEGNNIKVKYSCEITSLSSKNALTSIVKYKKTTDTTYTSQTDISASTTASYTDREVIIADPDGASYDIELVLRDNFNTGDTIKERTSVSTPFTFIHYKDEDSMGLGKLAELDHGLDVGFKTRFNNGFVAPILQNGTDLNDVMDPNVYNANNANAAGYLNLPDGLTSGTFSLIVVEQGPVGQRKQILELCDKDKYRVFERTYYSQTWGDWKYTSNDYRLYFNSGGQLQVDAISHIHNNMVFDNGTPLYGRDTSGNTVVAFEPKNGSNNTVLGYGNYSAGSGDTNIYGNDVKIGVANISTKGAYRPYYRRGDTAYAYIRTAGYVTSTSKNINFTIPLTKPIIGSPTVTVTSGNGIILRQNGSYTSGSGSSTWAKPSSYSAVVKDYGIETVAVMSSTTNIENNGAIGVQADVVITFS